MIIVQARILTSLSALTFFAALFTFLICTLTIRIYIQVHWSTIPTKMAKSEIFSCRRSRVCELWSHFNPAVEERWKRPLPLQRLRWSYHHHCHHQNNCHHDQYHMHMLLLKSSSSPATQAFTTR